MYAAVLKSKDAATHPLITERLGYVLYRVSIKSVCTLENFNFICAHGLYGHPIADEFILLVNLNVLSLPKN